LPVEAIWVFTQRMFGLIYVGSDDGFVNLTKNGGGSWTRISNNLPQNLWVSRVIASAHKKERVYATLNGYRFDDFTPYVYVSDDYGQTWKNIGSSIPISAVNVIKEDPENENILYLGTDNGLYISFDKGNSWQAFGNNLPNVAIHDLVIQPKSKHLIVGTHGRSLYKIDVAQLQKMTAKTLKKDIVIFDISDVKKNRNWGRSWSQWRDAYEPELEVPFYVNSDRAITVNIFKDDVKVNSLKFQATKGFNKVIYDLSFSKKGLKEFNKINDKGYRKAAQNGIFYLPKEKYIVKIEDAKGNFEVK